MQMYIRTKIKEKSKETFLSFQQGRRMARRRHNDSSKAVTNIFTGVRDDCVKEESAVSQGEHPSSFSSFSVLRWDLLFLRFSSDVGVPRKRDSQESPLFPTTCQCLKPYIYHHLVKRSFEKETLEVTSAPLPATSQREYRSSKSSDP